MKTKTLSPRERRQRKFFLVLPAIVLPFTTLLFLSLGGGTVDIANAGVHPGKGLNSQLPNARLKDDRGLTKMSYYDQVASDSARIRQQLKRDPYYHGADADSLHFSVRPQKTWSPKNGGSYFSGLTGHDRPDAKANEAYERLAQLQTVINKPPQAGKPNADYSSADIALADKSPKDITLSKEDPELTQMSGLLEKILDIQHPDRVIQKANAQDLPISNNRFQAIPAVIDGKQKITEGTVVRMKLLDTITINGQFIPKGQLLFGSGQLNNQRLTMTIKLIRMGNNILPVDLTVFDMIDGLEGICVPEAITGDAVRDGAANGVQGLELMSFDPAVGTQLAGAGINAAKGLFSRKVKRIKAKLQNGHRLLLRDNKKVRESQK
ncbi:MAG: conjugative transposon TraM protein [Mucilaginibacter sp.]|nr:conjugative transposon TraM protein [Mucilaginibacter sp.]